MKELQMNSNGFDNLNLYTENVNPNSKKDISAVDVVLLKMPNHNMDYPHLATPTLTAALRRKFYKVVQKDINVLLRDYLLTEEILCELTHSYLPSIAMATIDNASDFERIRNAVTYLRFIEDTLGFEVIQKTKERMQVRDYDRLFSNNEDAQVVSLLFVLTGLLHTIIDICLIYETVKLPVRNPVIDYFNEVANQIAEMEPRVVGFSVIQIQRRATLILARMLKERFRTTIVVGGPDISTFKEEYLNVTQDIDFCMLKEAETTFTDFLGGKDWSELDGIVYRGKSGEVVVREANYDRAQSEFNPDFDGYDLEKFLLPTLPLSTSRGCHFAKCTFCNHYKTYSGYYSNDAIKTVNNLERLVTRYGVRFFHFVDDMLQIEEGTAIAEELIRRGLKVNILTYARFEAGFRDPQILALWYKAGIRVIEWGLESASQKVLKKMIKGVSIKQVQNILDISANEGIVNKLMLFHNYPGEELDDLKQTVDFLRKNTFEKKVRPFFTVRGKLELRLFTPLEVESRDRSSSPFIKRYERSSSFDSLLGYADSEEYYRKVEYIDSFIKEMSSYVLDNDIYSTNDENMSMDLITLDMCDRGIKPAFNVQ